MFEDTEGVIRGRMPRTDNTMAKRKRTKTNNDPQNTTYTTKD